MPALSGQLKPKTTQWGKMGYGKIDPMNPPTPQQNLANAKDWIKGWGQKKLDKAMGKTDPTAPADGTFFNTQTADPASGTAPQSQTQAGNSTTTTQQQGSNTQTAQTSTPPAQQPAGTPPAAPAAPAAPTPPDPPAGILPGTPAYSAWLEDWKKKNPAPAAADPAAPAGTTGSTSTTGGIKFAAKAKGTRGWNAFKDGFEVSPELMAKIPPEAQQELRDLAAKGADVGSLQALQMKYWGEDWAKELGSAMKSGAMARPVNPRAGSWQGPGQTGIKWMDQKYADNMWAKDPENPANKPKEPVPASGDGVWEQGPSGPIWKPKQPQGEQPPYQGGVYDQWPGDYGGNPWNMWMQQQFTNRYGG